MSEAHVEQHSSFIKTLRQVLVVMILAFAVPVAVILTIVHFVIGGLRVDRASSAMSEEAVAARLKPVGEVNFDPAAPGSATPVPGSIGGGTAQAPAVAANAGEHVYQTACMACHGAGVLNAPKFGDPAAWKARIAQGMPTLYQHAIKGIRTMPAKGGNTALSDAEVEDAVDYMVSKSK